jgi:hypothetical protein
LSGHKFILFIKIEAIIAEQAVKNLQSFAIFIGQEDGDFFSLDQKECNLPKMGSLF